MNGPAGCGVCGSVRVLRDGRCALCGGRPAAGCETCPAPATRHLARTATAASVTTTHRLCAACFDREWASCRDGGSLYAVGTRALV